MLRDGFGATGWYVECGDEAVASLVRAGFYEVALAYRQPPLSPGGPAPGLHLRYKSFGRAYEAPKLEGEKLLEATRQIYRVVYAIDRPEDSDLYWNLARQVPAGVVPFR